MPPLKDLADVETTTYADSALNKSPCGLSTGEVVDIGQAIVSWFDPPAHQAGYGESTVQNTANRTLCKMLAVV